MRCFVGCIALVIVVMVVGVAQPNNAELLLPSYVQRIRNIQERLEGIGCENSWITDGRRCDFGPSASPYRSNEIEDATTSLYKQTKEPGRIKKLFYYRHPLEAFRFEYQPLVRQTNDHEPIGFHPLMWRANRGFGFNEWGAQGGAA